MHNTTLYITNTNRLKPVLQTVGSKVLQKTPTLIGVRKRGLKISLQHRLSAQSINMLPNAVLTFNHNLGVQIICLGYLWFLLNVDKKCL